MKIYTRVVLDMATSEILEADSYEYDGPVALCAGGGKAPKAPDPVVVAQAQTDTNRDTAEYNAALNRVNTYTPQGSSVFSQTGTDASGAPTYRQDVTLTPDAQALYEQQQRQSRQLGDTAQNMVSRVDQTLGQPMDTSKVPKLFGADDLLGARQQTQDALYNRQAAYLDPQWNQREGLFKSTMANKGIVEGSEAWKNALDDENRARSFDYGQARNAAIAGGASEMNTVSNIARGNRGMSMEELYATRNQPLNEYNALRTSAQVDMPQFQGAPQSNAGAADTQGNYWNQYNGDMAKWNASQAEANSINGGLFGLGAAAVSTAPYWMPLLSDERLKEDIEPIGELPGGGMAYEYSYKFDPEKTRHAGVMAQDLERTQPDAVLTHSSGYKAVDYAKVLARAMEARHGA